LGETGVEDSESLDRTVQRLSDSLAANIRRGKCDGDARVHTALLEMTERLLAESNPKALLSKREGEPR
jgi:hypothetical protein